MKNRLLKIIDILGRVFSFNTVKSFLVLAFLAVAACTDQGCIDADDFGEYESQTIKVQANAAKEVCTHDATKDLTDPGQGSGLKSCFTYDSITIDNGPGNAQSSNKGCVGIDSAPLREICIQNCINRCLNNSSGGSDGAEPSWTSTDQKVPGKNMGVTISPNSEISIRAIGFINLGDSMEYNSVYVSPKVTFPHSYNKEWAPTFFDVKNGQSLLLKFSGRWTDGPSDADGEGNSSPVEIGAGSSNLSIADPSSIYNGANRTAIYAIPHPNGYDFDSSQISERDGSKNLPLLPDPNAWTCTYISSGDEKQSICQSTSYQNAGYGKVDDSLANATFPISSEYRTAALGKIGGAIRWNNDGIENANFDPFVNAGVVCDTASAKCSNMGGVNPEFGVIGDAPSFTNQYPSSYQVSFRFLASGCDAANISSVSIINPANNEKYDEVINLEVKGSTWTTTPISIEPNHQLTIGTINKDVNGNNCKKFLAIRLLKYQDIKIERSGFVKFATLGTSDAKGNCNLVGRIINPEGNHREFSGLMQDFYEYDNLNYTDPLTSLSVPFSSSTIQAWSKAIYVRKGQVIRLNPNSWNSSWTAANNNGASIKRQCGAGMVMTVEPRPALLCRGKSPALVDNPNCAKVYESGQLVGCELTTPSACLDQSSSPGSYCPAIECAFKINCTPGSISNLFTRNCTYVAQNSPPASCANTPLSAKDPNKCLSCAQAMTSSENNMPAKKEVANIDVCYDLENYKGSVANIKKGNLTKVAVDDFINTPSIAKGATLLRAFNGSYGNLSNFSPVTASATASGKLVQQVDAGNTIYQLSSPIMTNMGARLKFFVLDGEDFNYSSNPNPISKYYDNNSDGGSSYNGTNGIKIYPSSGMEFSNGDMLQARLCKEPSSDANSFMCKSLNPSQLTGQPALVENLLDISGSSPKTLYSGNYKFDSYGTLTRTSAAAAPGDCAPSDNSAGSFLGAQFYCHTDSSDANRMRLSFKIFDPEIGDDICGGNSRIKLKNPYYKSSVSANAGGLCTNDGVTRGEVPGDGTSTSAPIGTDYANCQKEFFCANKYHNNSGEYYVNVRVKNPANKNISNIISAVIKPIVDLMDGTPDDPKTEGVDEYKMGQAERVYKLLIADPRYKAILTMALVVMFTFYGLGYLMGVSELKHDEIIGRILKIGIIYLFVGETGWDWFNKIVVHFFKEGTDYLAFMMASAFDDSPVLAQAIDTGTFTDKSVLFSSVDRVLSLFFSSVVQKKIAALLFASIFGWAYVLIIYYSFMLYLFSVANAVLLYLTSQVFISIIFVLGPIFFIFLLFNQTKEMFDNWLKQLIGFSLQQIFLLTTLAFFNMLIYEVIKMSLGYKICWDDVWTINIITRITLLSFWTVAALPPSSNMQSDIGNIGNPEGIPSLFSILFIWVISSLMGQFIEFVTNIASLISGGLSASALSKGVTDAANQVSGAMQQVGGKVWEKTGEKLLNRADKALFDSGKLADQEREKAEQKNERDLANRGSMVSAGDKAVEEFKKNNANELVGKTQKEQRNMLKDVREKAMMKEGDKLGLSEKESKDLLADTGLKYEGSNVFGALASVARQGFSSGGALFNAAKDKEVEASFTVSEAQEAMENMNSDERKKFIESAKRGEIHVKKRFDQINNIENPSEGAKEIFGFGEYLEAEKQLENESLIDEVKGGFGWSRSSKDKKKIEERMKANIEKKKIDKLSSSSALKDLEAQDRYLARKEKLEKNALSGDVGAATEFTQSVGNYFDTSSLNPFRDEKIEEKYKDYDQKAVEGHREKENTKAKELKDSIYKEDEIGGKMVKTGKLQDARGNTQNALDKIKNKYGAEHGAVVKYLEKEMELKREKMKDKPDSDKVERLEADLKLQREDSDFKKQMEDLNGKDGYDVDYRNMTNELSGSYAKEVELTHELRHSEELVRRTEPNKPVPGGENN